MIMKLTCRSEDCNNKDVEIEFADPEDLVICGACHNEVTDKIEVVES
jgi:hypothetical protein